MSWAELQHSARQGCQQSVGLQHSPLRGWQQFVGACAVLAVQGGLAPAPRSRYKPTFLSAGTVRGGSIQPCRAADQPLPPAAALAAGRPPKDGIYKPERVAALFGVKLEKLAQPKEAPFEPWNDVLKGGPASRERGGRAGMVSAVGRRQ